MALLKNKTTKYGVDGNYWKITGLQTVDFIKGTVQSKLSLYINKQARLDGKTPIDSVQLTQNFTPEELNGDIRAIAYTKAVVSKMIKKLKTPEKREMIAGKLVVTPAVY